MFKTVIVMSRNHKGDNLTNKQTSLNIHGIFFLFISYFMKNISKIKKCETYPHLSPPRPINKRVRHRDVFNLYTVRHREVLNLYTIHEAPSCGCPTEDYQSFIGGE